MTTITTTQDLLRAARENREFREAFRREILTDELLELPQRFADYTKVTDSRLSNIEKTLATLTENTVATNRRLDSLEGKVDSLGERVDSLGGKVDSLGERVDSLGEKVEQNSKDINGLGEMFRAEVKAQSSFRGTYALEASRKDDREVAWLFAYKYGLRLIKTRQVLDDVLENWLADNVALIESLNLRERAWRTFPGSDLVVEVRDLQARLDSTPAYFIVLESSYTIEKEDVLKSTDHARIIKAVTGVDAYAVVAGVNMDDEMDAEILGRIHMEAESFLETDDPETVFWHRLDSADLRPAEPR